MDLKQLNPWNWAKHEENPSIASDKDSRSLAERTMNSSPMMQLHQDIDRLFNEAMRGFGAPSIGDTSFFNSNSDLLKPSTNIAADDKNYTITVEVPGVDESEVELELSNNTLTIKGEKHKEQEEQNKEFHRIERSFGKFERVLSLPQDAIQDDIKADFKNGILTVNIPRKVKSKAEVRHINIKKAS